VIAIDTSVSMKGFKSGERYETEATIALIPICGGMITGSSTMLPEIVV
jgi:hypothetical protein